VGCCCGPSHTEAGLAGFGANARENEFVPATLQELLAG
jgi:hypothetical protein